MYLCPNCRTCFLKHSSSCASCGWQAQEIEGIKVFLSQNDQQDVFFREYLDSYHELSVNDIEHGIVDGTYLSNQAEKMLSYYVGPAERILEVGVGQGFLLSRLHNKYPASSVTAVDISIPFLKHVQSIAQVECILANAENLPFEEEFDLLVASDILEHVINPIDFLLSANYALKSNGTMLLRVPFEDNMLQYSRLLGCQYKFAHLRNFSKRNLELILRQAGFRLEKIHYDGYYISSRRKLFYRRIFQRLFESVIRRLYPNEHNVSKIPNWLGFLLMRPLEIVVVAKKLEKVTDMNFNYWD